MQSHSTAAAAAATVTADAAVSVVVVDSIHSSVRPFHHSLRLSKGGARAVSSFFFVYTHSRNWTELDWTVKSQ